MGRINFLRLWRCPSKGINRFYTNQPQNPYRNVLKLYERGMYQELFPETSANDITYLLNKSPQCVYAGFDPTADSLHVGNLLVLMNLLHWQRGGHRVIALVGGATGLIGDPSHREKERSHIDEETINNNINSIQKNIETIFQNHEKYFLHDKKFQLTPVTIVNNKDWYKDINVIEFISTIGKCFRMGTMLNRTSVQARLKSETGMSFTEFTYQVFQAYDWLYLFNKYGCRFQIGGSDQLGNISTGYDLINRTTKKDVFGFTLPLITAEGGKKFGKSLGNAVWLSPERSSSFQLYQFFIRTTDADIENYLKLFTFLTLKQINQIVAEHKEKPEQRRAQEILADNVTLLVHGEEGLLAAKNASVLLYDKSLEALSTMTQDQILLSFEGANIVDMIPDGRMTVFDLAMKAKCFKSESDAARIIQAGGFYINYERITDTDQKVKAKIHILPNNVTLLRTGKKTYHVVRWMKLHAIEDAESV